MAFLRNKLFLVVVFLALVAGVGLWAARPDAPVEEAIPVEREPLGLMTTLPIYWPEASSPGELLQGNAETHWARTALESRYELEPLDTLDAEGGLDSLKLLLLAQPRALSPQENVALDEWVRGGGRLLLFADPFLTGHYHFHIGDRRRPQDVALLSPILARWGLELIFDEEQEDAARQVNFGGTTLPVQLAGQFLLRPPAGDAEASCELMADGLGAECAIGEGHVLVIADAAVLEAAPEAESFLRLAGIAFAGE